jgi:hypothetical protein
MRADAFAVCNGHRAATVLRGAIADVYTKVVGQVAGAVVEKLAVEPATDVMTGEKQPSEVNIGDNLGPALREEAPAATLGAGTDAAVEKGAEMAFGAAGISHGDVAEGARQSASSGLQEGGRRAQVQSPPAVRRTALTLSPAVHEQSNRIPRCSN